MKTPKIPAWLPGLMAAAEAALPSGAARRAWVIRVARELAPDVADPVVALAIEVVWAAVYSPGAVAKRKARREKRKARA